MSDCSNLDDAFCLCYDFFLIFQKILFISYPVYFSLFDFHFSPVFSLSLKKLTLHFVMNFSYFSCILLLFH